MLGGILRGFHQSPPDADADGQTTRGQHGIHVIAVKEFEPVFVEGRRGEFPSTSTARTTIADTEIITAAGAYRAAVTFISEFEVRANIDECIEAACLAVTEGQPESKVAAALLTHHEQRFRLSYLLGDWSGEESVDDDEFAFDDGALEDAGLRDEDKVSDEERRINETRVGAYLDRVRGLATEIDGRTEGDFGPLAEQKTPEDRAAWLELYSDRLFESEEFVKLSLDIRDDIESRFEFLDQEALERTATGWPVVWSFETTDRELFLRKVRWFSSNHHREFGRLLTPLVDGIREDYPHQRTPHLRPQGAALFSGSRRKYLFRPRVRDRR